MSFILDALRKSESERLRESGPTLARVPLAVAHPTVPLWVWIAMGALGVSSIVLGGLWWQTARNDGTADATLTRVGGQALSEADEPSSAPPVRPVVNEATPPATAAPDTALTDEPPGEAPRAPARAEPAALTLASESAAATPPAAVAPPPPAATRTTASSGASGGRPSAEVSLVRSVAELIASGFTMPPLVFELHVFDPDPAKRSVFFSGAVYREGQRIPQGPTVAEITPEGVVLEQNGRRALLTSQ